MSEHDYFTDFGFDTDQDIEDDAREQCWNRVLGDKITEPPIDIGYVVGLSDSGANPYNVLAVDKDNG